LRQPLERCSLLGRHRLSSAERRSWRFQFLD
jgi:hypothetical protein